MKTTKPAPRKATSPQRAAWAVITRSLRGESGRYLSQERGAALLAKCRIAETGPYCATEYAPDDAIELLREYDQALGTLQEYAQYAKDVELRSLVHELRKELRLAAADVVQQQSRRSAAHMSDAYAELEGDLPAFIDTREVDSIDITGLEATEARELALHLKRWNPNSRKVYSWRKGKRYLHPSVTILDLNHPFIKGMSFREDLLALVKERNIPVEYEQII